MTFPMRLMACLLLLVSVSVTAQEQSGKSAVLPDSSNFVTASIIVISPGSQIYSTFGHCALRMECPSEDLDYCYTFESNPSAFGVIQYLTGHLLWLCLPKSSFPIIRMRAGKYCSGN